MQRAWVIFLAGLLVAGACTGSTADTTTSSIRATTTTRPAFDPLVWSADQLVEIRSEGIAASESYDIATAFGVPVSPDGLILTTASAVLGADRINVFLPGEEFPVEADLEAAAECRDLALIDVGRPLPTVVELGSAHGPAVWAVSVRDGEPVSGDFGPAHTSPRLNLDRDGAVASLEGVGGLIPVEEVNEALAQMRRREVVSELGFLAAPVAGGLEVVAVAGGAEQLEVGDVITVLDGDAPPSLDRLCSLFAAGPVPMRLQREGREWEGELGGVPFELTSARTVEEIRAATVRVDVDHDGDGSPDGSGSGFFVSESGFVVTNHHVVAGAPATGAVEVVFDGAADRRPAAIIGRSSCADLALLRVDGAGFTHLVWSPDPPRLDEAVRSVGYPDGTDQLTIKRGNVSKEFGTRIVYTPTVPTFEHSAETIPGSSGGPVVNDIGEVIGIVFGGRFTFGITEELAISGADARPIADQLELGDVQHLGLSLSWGGEGVFVEAVDQGSIAEAAGFRRFDELLEFGGHHPLSDEFDVQELCGLGLPGDEVPLQVLRFEDGATYEMDGFLHGRPLERIPEPFRVADPSGILGTLVPGRWTDYQGIEPSAERDFIGFRAAPDVDKFLNAGYGAHPGMRVLVSWQEGTERTPRERLEQTTYAQCSDAGITAVTEREYEGFVRRWTNCQGTTSMLLDYAMTDTLQPPLMVVITVISPADEIDTVADLVISNWGVGFLPPP